MTDVIETCRRIWEDPFAEAAKWKEATKGKVIGGYPMFMPEELVHAAGALPVYIHPAHETVTLANKHLESFYCPPLRTGFDSLLKGHFDVVDGLLYVRVCDEIMKVAEIAEMLKIKPWVRLYRLPYTLFKPVWQEMLTKYTWRLKRNVEELVEHRITDEALHHSITVYNVNRSLLCRLYDLRRQNPGLLHNTDLMAVVASSMLMPKEQNNELLKKLLSELDGKKGRAKGVKVVLAGGICDDPGEGVLQTLEEAGLVVVDDELFIGGRYFRDDISNEGQPIEALARFHWEKSPCPTSMTKERRDYAPYLIELVKRSGAQGIVQFEWKYCEYQSWEHYYLRRSFAEAGIPHLRVDLSEETLAREALRTRFEAFAETIGGA